MNHLAIEFPPLPLALHPTSPPGRWEKIATAKKYRHEGGLATLAAMNAAGLGRPRWKRARTRLIYFVKDNRHRDQDNLLLWAAAYFDSLADAGLIADDRGLVHSDPAVVIWPDEVKVRIEVARIGKD